MQSLDIVSPMLTWAHIGQSGHVRVSEDRHIVIDVMKSCAGHMKVAPAGAVPGKQVVLTPPSRDFIVGLAKAQFWARHTVYTGKMTYGATYYPHRTKPNRRRYHRLSPARSLYIVVQIRSIRVCEQHRIHMTAGVVLMPVITNHVAERPIATRKSFF